MYRENSIQSLALKFIEEKKEDSFRKLINRLKPGLMGFAYKYLKDMDSAKEVVSQVFIIVWEKSHQYNPKWNFSTWVYSIAKNESLGALRLKKRNISHEKLEENQSRVLRIYSPEVNMDTEVIGPSVDEIIDSLHEKTLEEIDNLSEPYRSIMIERELKNKQLQDIAKDLDMNLSTVKTRIRKARKDIQDSILEKHPSLVKAYYERDEE